MKRVLIDCKERFPDYYFTALDRPASFTETAVFVSEEQSQRWADTIAAYNLVQSEIKEAFITAKVEKVSGVRK